VRQAGFIRHDPHLGRAPIRQLGINLVHPVDLGRRQDGTILGVQAQPRIAPECEPRRVDSPPLVHHDPDPRSPPDDRHVVLEHSPVTRRKTGVVRFLKDPADPFVGHVEDVVMNVPSAGGNPCHMGLAPDEPVARHRDIRRFAGRIRRAEVHWARRPADAHDAPPCIVKEARLDQDARRAAPNLDSPALPAVGSPEEAAVLDQAAMAPDDVDRRAVPAVESTVSNDEVIHPRQFQCIVIRLAARCGDRQVIQDDVV